MSFALPPVQHRKNIVRATAFATILLLSAPALAQNQTPVITTTPVSLAVEDVAYAYDANHSDPDGPGETWLVENSDTCGGTVNTPTGVYTFTPAWPLTATCLVSISVCDGASPSLCAAETTTVTLSASGPCGVGSAAQYAVQLRGHVTSQRHAPQRALPARPTASHRTQRSAEAPLENAISPSAAPVPASAGPCDLQDACAGTLGAIATCQQRVAAAGTQCRAAGCLLGLHAPTAKCDGASTDCPATVSVDCSPYACNGDVCGCSVRGDGFQGKAGWLILMLLAVGRWRRGSRSSSRQRVVQPRPAGVHRRV